MEERKQIPNDATSRKVAKAAILMAISDSREEERRLKEEKNAEGMKLAAMDFGGEALTSVPKIIERAEVKGKGSFWTATLRRVQ